MWSSSLETPSYGNVLLLYSETTLRAGYIQPWLFYEEATWFSPSVMSCVQFTGQRKAKISSWQSLSLHQDWWLSRAGGEETAAHHKTHVYHGSSGRNRDFLSNVFHRKCCFSCQLAEYGARMMCGSQESQLSNPISAIFNALKLNAFFSLEQIINKPCKNHSSAAAENLFSGV